MTAAIHAQGTVLKRGDAASPEVFTAVGNITTFKGPGVGAATVIDTTNLSSTAKEKMLGLRDPGQFTFTINYLPTDTGHKGLITDATAGTLRNFKIVFADGSSSEVAFSGYVLNFDVDGAVDGKLAANVTLELSGAKTWPS